MELIDFSNARESRRMYGGSERKLGIFWRGSFYMIKFKKKMHSTFRNNHLSEYIGSHIYELLGIETHRTILGMYKGHEVVACLDFLKPGSYFVPFNSVGESTLDTDIEHHQYSYGEIVVLLQQNKRLTDVENTVERFFDMYIVDALIGNFDRHGGNWGFIKERGEYRLAPVFDNGSSLFPNMVDEDEMERVLNDQGQIDLRVYMFPTSQILLYGKKSSYFEIISSLSMPEVNEALSRIFPRINIDDICSFVDSIEEISDIHKKFYKTILRNRYEKILKYSYEKLHGGSI